MSHPILRLNDGSGDTSPELAPDVRELQEELNQQGFALDTDGVFGRETESAVKQFQLDRQLDDDGIVGPLTWAALLGTAAPDPATVFPTTFSRTNAALQEQFNEANAKYKTFVVQAAQKFQFDAVVIGGIGSRESGWGLLLKPKGPDGTGDFAGRKSPAQFRTGPLPPDGGGFGRGLMQIDFDAFSFARTGNWKDPAANILFGARVLADSRDFFNRRTSLQGRDLLRAALAGYNARPARVLTAIQQGRDVDFFTTGHDYSSDVLNRAGFFQMAGWT